MAPTIANTGDHIVVIQAAADIAGQREAMAASIAAMSSAVLPQVPAGTELEHVQYMIEVGSWIITLFELRQVGRPKLVEDITSRSYFTRT